MSGKRVLITGGAGYLGSVMVPRLLDHAYQVTVLDNFMYRQESLFGVAQHPNFDIVFGDARDPEVLKPLVAKADLLVPLAAIVGAPACRRDQTAAKSINYDAVVTLLELASKEQRVFFPVSNSGYGVGEKGKYCTEESPLRPISLYGITKVDAEKAVLDRGNCVTFRLATVFGPAPRMRLDLLVNDFTHRALTERVLVLFEAHFMRNYIHVGDIARTFHWAMENFDDVKNETYNVGLSSANMSKMDLAKKIREHVPELHIFESKIGEDPDKRDYIVSNEKIESRGWRSEYSIDDGIRGLIRVYQMVRPSITMTNL